MIESIGIFVMFMIVGMFLGVTVVAMCTAAKDSEVDDE